VSGHSLITRGGIPSARRPLESLGHFIALLISTAKIRPLGKKFNITEWEDLMVGEVILEMHLE
jgi:hypothetical protein